MWNGHIANLCHQDVEGYTIEDTSVCSIHFKNGALGSICGSNCSVKEQWNGRFRVICEHMTADFTDHNHGVFTLQMRKSSVQKRLRRKWMPRIWRTAVL